MKKISLSLIFLLAVALQVTATDVSSLNPIQPFDVNTELVDRAITFNATLPASYSKDNDKKYVLFIDFHPRSQPMHAGMHDWMSHNGAWPWLESIIITPASYDEEFRGLYMNYVEGKDTQLLDFIEHDLLATAEQKFRVNGFRIYSGFTGNGTAGLSIFLDKPDLFNAFIIASPVLKDHPLNIQEKLKTKLPKLTNKPRYVMLSTSDSGYEQAQLPAFEALNQTFTQLAPKNITLSTKRFDGTYYMTQPVLATSNAIEEIFHDVHQVLPADSTVSKQGAQAIIEYFAYLSKEKYGFEVSAQPSLKKLGLALVKTDPDEAIKVLKTAIKEYPTSAFAYDALATAYLKLEQPSKAAEAQKLAVEHSANLVKFWQIKHQEKLEKYQSLIAKK